MELARAATGQDPYDKYPRKNGRAIVVAQNGTNIGETVWKKLGRQGAFNIIKDSDTGDFRVFQPWTDSDRPKHHKLPAPPLLDPRYIKSISWEEKKTAIPKLVKLHNGWEIMFFSSNATPIKGVDVDIVVFDEEVEDHWYTEMVARLVDRNGKFWWSVTPEVGGTALYKLHQRYKEGDPSIEEYLCLISDNPYMTDVQRARFMRELTTEEERRVKFYGEYARSGRTVYPEFEEARHVVKWFEIPPDWTRYACIDPGRNCAVIFAAVPPPGHKLAGHIVFYDEIFETKCSATILAEKMAEKVRGHEFYAFIIDHQSARIVETAYGKSIEVQYEEEFKRRGVKSVTTGSGFVHGDNKTKKPGISAFRGWLESMDDGIPKVLLLEGKMPHFIKELDNYIYQKDAKGYILDKPVDRDDHLADCAAMLAMYDPIYHKPAGRGGESWIMKTFLEKKKRLQLMLYGEERNYVSLGPRETG